MPNSLSALADRLQAVHDNLPEQENSRTPMPSFSFEPTPQAAPYMEHIQAAEEKYGLPKNLLARLLQQESGFNPQAVSPKGARGIAQIMPEYHPAAEPDDPAKAIDYAASYLRQNADHFGGDWEKAVAAYNAGPGTVERQGMSNLPAETQDYLQRIMERKPGGGQVDYNALADRLEAVDKRLSASPGFFESLAGDVAGGIVDLAEMYGRAGRALPGGEAAGADQGGIMSKAIKWAEDFRKAHPTLDYDPNRKGFSRWFHEGLRSAVTSIAAGAPGALAGMGVGSLINPGVGTFVGGVVGYATGGGTLFGMSQYDEVLEQARKAGVPMEVAEPAALRSAIYEGGFEFAADILEGVTLGEAKLLTTPAKEGLKQGVASLFRTSVKQMLKRGAAFATIETGSEMLTGALQTEELHRMGLTDQRFMDGAIDAFGPSLVASMIFFGLGEYGRSRVSAKIKNNLKDPQAAPEKRMAAVKAVQEAIAPASQPVADAWADAATRAVAAGEPIDLDAPIATDEQLDARIQADEDLADQAAQAATAEYSRPVEQDVADHEASKAADPLGDDALAQDIIDKVAFGQPTRVAPVATTPRGEGAEELLAAMAETTAPAPPVEEQLFHDERSGKVLRVAESGGQFGIFKTATPETHKGKHVKGTEWYASREEAEAALATYAGERQFAPTTAQQFTQQMADEARRLAEAQRRIPEELQPVADQAWRYINSVQFDAAIEDGTITAATGVAKEDIRSLIADVGKSAEGFKGSTGLYRAATGVDQLYDLSDEQLTQYAERIPEELKAQIQETKGKQAGVAPRPEGPRPPRTNIPPGGSRQSAIEYNYFLTYEGAKEFPGVAHKDLVAVQIYDKAGEGSKMLDVWFATRKNVDQIKEEAAGQYPDAYITLSHDLTPYRPKKGEISFQEYAAQRDQGIDSPEMMKAEAETPSTQVETPAAQAQDYETLWDDIRKDTRNGTFILKKAGFGAPHGWLNEAGVQAIKNNLSSLTPANQEKIKKAIDTWWNKPEAAPAEQPPASAEPAPAPAPAGLHANQVTAADLYRLTSDKKGVLANHGVQLYDKLADARDAIKAVGPRGADESIGQYLGKLRNYQKQQRAETRVSNVQLKGDYGVEHIDAYSDAGEKAKNALKNDARRYLLSVNQALGYEADVTKQSKVGVTYNAGGIGVGGDTTGIFWKPGSDYGAYVQIGHTVVPGAEGSPSGVSIMWRVTTKEQKYAGRENQWEDWNINAADLAKKMRAEVDRVETADKATAAPETWSRDQWERVPGGAYRSLFGNYLISGEQGAFRLTDESTGRQVGGTYTDRDTAAVRAVEDYRQQKGKAPAGGAEMGTVAPAVKEGRPYERIAEYVRQRLKNRETTTPNLLLREANEAFGGSLAQGTFSIKQVYDAMELGVNQYILQDLELQNQTPQQVIEHLKSLLADLPTQTRRTHEADELQQFSTPPPLSYMANWVANIRRGDQYLEPSAGVGGLAVFGKKFGASPIIVNEIADYRKKLLMSLPFDSFISEDGSQIGNMRDAPHMKNIRPDVVVMNPPFSSTSGRIPGKRSTMEGARHVEQALKILKDGGRLVTITGRGMSMDRPTFKDWWEKIQQQYNVRANVGVSGQEYAKYGTTFDNQLIVIDKTGPTTKDVVIGSVAKTEDLIPILQEVRDDRALTSQPHAVEPAGEKAPAAPQVRPRPEGSLRPAAGPVGLGQQPGGPALAGRPAAGLPERPAGLEGPGVGRPVSGERPQRPTGGRPEGEPGGAGGGHPGAAARPAGGRKGGLSLEEKEIEARQEEISESLYEGYKPERLNIPGAQPHPTPLVQSAAMAAVQPPKPTYKPHLPDRVIKGNAKKQGVSDIQIEAVVYAGQAHERKLPDGTRMGYFIGDGTGVGKGREIAAIMLDNWNQGRKKAVWLSEKASLFHDARRDMENILWNPNLVFPLNKIKTGAPIGAEQGVLFTTYDTIKQPAKEGQQRRLDQVVNWLGKDFDGVIAMDEAHNMGNALEVQTERGRKKPSQKALAGMELQRLLPNARIVYVSATGATEVMNLAYASRLGLWGEGTPFADNRRFVNEITAGGIAAMEMVAQDLKAQGKYTARSLSYDGVAYDRIVHELSPDQVEQYNTMVEAWQIVLQNIGQAMEESGAAQDGKAKSRVMNAFWGAQLRFFNILLTGLQLPSMIAKAKNDLANGKSVVIQMTSTGESAMDRAMATDEEVDLETLDLSPIEGLMEYVQSSFPVAQYEQVMDEDGNTVLQVVTDSAGNIVQNPEAVAMREALLDRLGALRGEIPGNPLDSLLEVFGPEITAEVTGRKRRLVTNDEGKRVIEKRSRAKGDADADAFMAGKKHLLIFSESGGTGRSYHADLASENQEKRSHYLLQAGWRADKAVQGLGRTHRSNQASPPEYWLVTTNLAGQRRFISTIARRLDQLGALTRGSRETGSQGIFGLKDNLEADHVHDALRQFIVDVYVNEVPGLTIQELQEQTGLHLVDQDGNLLNTPLKITQFLNRILCLPVAQQNKVFGAFEERIDSIFNDRLNSGTLDVGLETLRAQSIKKVSEEEVYQDEETGATTRYIQLDVSQPNKRRLAWEDGPEEMPQFIQNRRSGQVWAIERANKVDPESGERRKDYRLLGPNNSRQNVKEADGDAKMASGAWTELTRDQARGLWQAQYAQLPETINYKEHIVTGLLLPIWDRLIGHPQLLRIQTDAGERFIGRRISEQFLAQTLENLGASAAKIDMSPAQVHANVLHNNYDVRLANGWEIKRSKVSGENRIELRNISWSDYQLFEKYGLFHERINWQTRYFIPTGTEQGAAAIEALMVNRPIVKASPPTTVRYGMEAGGGEVEEAPAGYGVQPLQGQAPGVPLEQEQRIPRQLPLFGYEQHDEIKPTDQDQLTFKKTRKVSHPGTVQITLARTGSLRARSERVFNGSDAAALLAHLTKDAQENVYFVSTDSTGRVLEIHRYSRGAKNRSLVSAIEGIGHLLDQPQVARVFFVHNHPATILSEETGREILAPSKDDRSVVDQLRKFLSLADIDLTSVVLGGNRFMEFDEWPGNDSNRRQISATLKTAKPVQLPVRERRQKATGSKTGTAINYPETAVQEFKKRGDEDGVLFVNNQNVAMDFMPWPAGYSHRQAAKMMIARAARNNAAAIILNFKEADPSWMVPGNSRFDFISNFKQTLAGNLQVLDILLNHQSMLEAGRLPTGTKGSLKTDRTLLALGETDQTRRQLAAWRKFLDGEPVSVLTGEEFKKIEGGSLVGRVAAWFESEHGGVVISPDIGPVVLNKRGVRDSISHGLGKAKTAAFAAVPDILAKGRVISTEKNWKGRGYDTYLVAAPVKIADDEFVGIAVVRKFDYGQRYYLHEVVLKRKLQTLAFKTGASAATEAVELSGASDGAIIKVLRRIYSVKPSTALGVGGTDAQRRALDAQQVRNVQQVAGLVTDVLSRAGLSKELQDRIALEFKPIIDLRGKDVEQTVAQWVAQGQSVNTILGATTFKGLNALVEFSLEQDLATMERTAFHEGFHILANWVLPEGEYAKLMKSFDGNEEATANAFADYMAARSKPIGWVRRIFIKLRDLLRRVGNALRGAGFTVPEDIFGRLAGRAYTGQRPGMAGRTTIALMGEERAAQWYSQMERHLEDKLPESGTPAQIKQLLETWSKKGLIKAEELEWSGLPEWLDDFQKTKEAEWVEQQKQTPGIKKEIANDYMDFLLSRTETAQEGIQSYDRSINRLKNEAKKQKFSVNKGELLAQLAAGRVRVHEVMKGPQNNTFTMFEQGWTYTGLTDNEEGEFILNIPGRPNLTWYIEEDNSTDETLYQIVQREDDGGIRHENVVEETYSREEAEREIEAIAEREYEEITKFGDTKFERYQLPGGENYRELLMTLPTPSWYYEGRQDAPSREAEAQMFRTSHWDEPNVLAHVRFNERIGPDGERILFIEEIQSDWHQQGRKKGYRSKKAEEEYAKRNREGVAALKEAGLDPSPYDLGFLWAEGEGAREQDSRQKRISFLEEKFGKEWVDSTRTLAFSGIAGGVVDAPFKKTWPLLAIKRMVRYASEHGFDAIAWATGEVQADRYDLSKQVNALKWDSYKNDLGLTFEGLKGVSDQELEIQVKRDTGIVDVVDIGAPEQWVGKHLSEIIGKELAEKVLAQKKGRFEGEGLRVGGEGMKGFYDQILPAAVNKFFGKAAWGKAKVQQMPLERNRGQIDLVKRARHPEQFEKEQQPTVWAMRITPQMRAKALAEGMTLFQVKEGTNVFDEVLPAPVAEQIKAARGRERVPVKQRMTQWFKTLAATFNPGQMFPQMPNKHFGKENEILRRFVQIASWSKAKTIEDLKEILNPQKLGPAGYDLFNLKIVLDDMLYDIETEGRPLYDWEKRYGKLPFDFKDADQVRQSLAQIDGRIGANPEVAAALQRRRKIMRQLRRDLVAERLLPKSVLDDERYFHHEVLQYANAMAMAGTGTGSRDVRTHKKGWQIYRTGSLKAYNTQYLQSEFKVLAQGYAQLETKRILDELDASSNIIRELRDQARHHNYVAVVGGPEKWKRLQQLRNQVAYLRGDGGYLDSDTRAQLKELSNEIWELDPTMPFRQKIAIGMSKLAGVFDQDQYGELDEMSFADITQLADQGEPGALMVLKAVNERKAFIKEALGDNHLTWQKLMQERDPREGSQGWAEWIPKPGSAWYLTNSLSDKLLEQVAAGLPISEADIQKAWARGSDKRWVVPIELKEVLDGREFLKLQQENVAAAAAEKTLNWWKRWILINPFRLFKYNFNNLSGDADITLAYAPSIFKWTKGAARDLWAFHYDKPMNRATKEEFMRGIKYAAIDSGMTVHDIPDINDMSQFDQLTSALRADKPRAIDYIKRFWEGSKNFTTWRENVLRLAAYRYFLDEIGKGNNPYGASDPAKVDAADDKYKKAALLARELIGDYGGLSKGGQWLRRKMIPFYSWMEINAPRYWRMFKNLPIEGEPKGRRLRMGGVLAKKAGISLSKMALFYAMVQMFNHLVWPDEEEEMGDVGRRQLHLILGRRADGSIISVRMQGALSDALSWIGSEDIPQDIADVRKGRKRWWQLLAEAPLAVANRMVQGIRPDIKGPAELISGRQVFPDVTKPRPIRDRYEHLARMFSLDPIYRHLAGRPVKEGSVANQVLEDLGATITSTSDPGEAAFHQAKTLVFEYLADQNIERPPTDPTNRSNALYYYRKAIQLGDTQAAVRYLHQYKVLGGTPAGIKISIKRQHPLSGLPAKYRLRFMASLSPEDREVVKRGIEWYRKVYH